MRILVNIQFDTNEVDRNVIVQFLRETADSVERCPEDIRMHGSTLTTGDK